MRRSELECDRCGKVAKGPEQARELGFVVVAVYGAGAQSSLCDPFDLCHSCELDVREALRGSR